MASPLYTIPGARAARPLPRAGGARGAANPQGARNR